jgi:hypothetical protein
MGIESVNAQIVLAAANKRNRARIDPVSSNQKAKTWFVAWAAVECFVLVPATQFQGLLGGDEHARSSSIHW